MTGLGDDAAERPALLYPEILPQYNVLQYRGWLRRIRGLQYVVVESSIWLYGVASHR